MAGCAVLTFLASAEAVDNALLQETTVRSAAGTAEAIPIDRVRELLKK